MKKPYQDDLNFLNEELEHYKYILKKYTQEGVETYRQECERQCAYLHTAIEFMENRQATAFAEWTSLSEGQRNIILMPLYNALDRTINSLNHYGCTEFSMFLDHYLRGYFIDLIDCKEQ